MGKTKNQKKKGNKRTPGSKEQRKGDVSSLVAKTSKTSFKLRDANPELANQHDAMNFGGEEGTPVPGVYKFYMGLSWCEDSACRIENDLVCMHAQIIDQLVTRAAIASYNSFASIKKELGMELGTTNLELELELANRIRRKIDRAEVSGKNIPGDERCEIFAEDVRKNLLKMNKEFFCIGEMLRLITKKYFLDRFRFTKELLVQIWQQFQMRLSGCLCRINKIKQFLKAFFSTWELKVDWESLINFLQNLEEAIGKLYEGELGILYADMLQVQTDKNMLKTRIEELLVMYRDPEREIDSTNQNVSTLTELVKAADYRENASQCTTVCDTRLLGDEELVSLKVLADVSEKEELTPKLTEKSNSKSELTSEGLADASWEEQTCAEIFDRLKTESKHTLEHLADASGEGLTDGKIIEELESEVEQLKSDNFKLQSEIDGIDIELDKENVKLGHVKEVLEAKILREQAMLEEISVLEKKLQNSDVEIEQKLEGLQCLENLVCKEQTELGHLGDASIEFWQKISTTQDEYVITFQRIQDEAEERYLKAKIQLRSDDGFPKTFDSLRDSNSKLNQEVADLRAQSQQRKQNAEKFKEVLVEEQKRNQSWSVEMFRKVSSVEKKLERVEIEVQSWMGSQAVEELCKIDQIFDEVWQDILRDISG